jgi:hypothetical protein
LKFKLETFRIMIHKVIDITLVPKMYILFAKIIVLVD